MAYRLMAGTRLEFPAAGGDAARCTVADAARAGGPLGPGGLCGGGRWRRGGPHRARRAPRAAAQRCSKQVLRPVVLQP